MRFTPITFFGQGEIEPCCSAVAQGAQSQSYQLGSVQWDTFLFTSSVQAGGGSSELGQLTMSGSTSKAIVAVVGGGGAGDSRPTAGNAGGGGGFNVQTEVLLKDGLLYNIQVGQGGERYFNTSVAPGTLDGEDGVLSSFTGEGVNIVAGGGYGGIYNGNTSTNRGGNSGTPLAYTASDEGGAGTGADANDISSSKGLSFMWGDSCLFRAGGGGEGQSVSSPTAGDGYLYGGGQEASFNGLNIDGEGGAEDAGVYYFGGGGTGGYYTNVDGHYFTSNGGAGCVFVAIPTNLCSASLYTTDNIVQDSIITHYENTNARSFGKTPLNGRVKDIKRINGLETNGNTPNGLATTYTSSFGPLMSTTSSFDIDNTVNYKLGTVTLNNFLTGSLNGFNATSSFTLEWIGTRATGNMIQLRVGAGPSPTDNPKLNLGINQQLKYFSTVGVETTIAGTYDNNKHQHDIVYDGSELRWYIDAVLEGTASLSVDSELSNPKTWIGQNNIAGNMYFDSLKVYQKELSLSEIEQNYSASFIIPFQPTELFLASGSSELNACSSSISSTYYINNSDTLQAGTTIYTDYNLTITASDNYYQQDTSSDVFEIVGGVAQTFTSCTGFFTSGSLWRLTAPSPGSSIYSYIDTFDETITGSLSAGQQIDVCVSASYTPTNTGGSVTNLNVSCSQFTP